MLFNDDVLFLHVPKTGGMSVTSFLINNLPGRIHISVPRPAFEHTAGLSAFPDVNERLTLIPGIRHEDLRQTQKILGKHGRRLSDFQLLVSTIRNPYDLEVSYYFHLRKEAARKNGTNLRPALELAISGDFEAFVRNAPYYGHLPSRIERYYLIDGAMPPNMRTMRFENLEQELGIFAPFSLNRWELPHRNRTSGRPPWPDVVNQKCEHEIHQKYGFLFEFYPRHLESTACARALSSQDTLIT